MCALHLIRCGRRNAKRFTDPVMGVTASPMIQPISERFRTRKGFRSLRGDDVALRPRRKATPEWRASPPGLRERRHRSLARWLVAVRCALDAVGTVTARPHPRGGFGNVRFVTPECETRPYLETFLMAGGIVMRRTILASASKIGLHVR